MPGELRYGGAIYNKGRLRLRSGASFFDNGTGSHGDHVYAGDGGAIWNGNSGTMHIWGVTEVAGNVARGGGNGGGVYNEGVLHFHDGVFFEANMVSSGDGNSFALLTVILLAHCRQATISLARMEVHLCGHSCHETKAWGVLRMWPARNRSQISHVCANSPSLEKTPATAETQR